MLFITEAKRLQTNTKGIPMTRQSKAALFSRLIEEEAGQAMAELVVLLPVYLLLLILAMWIGQHQLTRQQTLEAARYFAWNGRSVRRITKKSFFPRFHSSGRIKVVEAKSGIFGQPTFASNLSTNSNQRQVDGLLDTQLIDKHTENKQSARALAKAYALNKYCSANPGKANLDFSRRHVVASFQGLRIPAISNWLGIELSAKRQHHVYIIKDLSKRYRDVYNDHQDVRYGRARRKRGRPHPFLTMVGKSQVPGLKPFDALSRRWHPLQHWRDGGDSRGPILKGRRGIEPNRSRSRGVKPGPSAKRYYQEKSQTLWNLRHELDGTRPKENTNPFFENVNARR